MASGLQYLKIALLGTPLLGRSREATIDSLESARTARAIFLVSFTFTFRFTAVVTSPGIAFLDVTIVPPLARALCAGRGAPVIGFKSAKAFARPERFRNLTPSIIDNQQQGVQKLTAPAVTMSG